MSGSTTVDDDVVPFGIRTIKYDADAGFSLNGTSLKFKGAGMHHDISGLGAAVPMRAWQRRLAQMKQIGINAIRTSHNPYAPEFLDLCDRMGFLVMDEFFDAWTGHKVAGDYGGTTFNNSGTAGPDRHHQARSQPPQRRPLQHRQRDPRRTLVAARHREEPDQHLPRHRLDAPGDAGAVPPEGQHYYPGNFVDVLDVFGANYRINEVAEACALSPHHPGVVTEAGTNTSDWSMITGNNQLTGEFIWTAFDYLGEAADMWPTVGSATGIMDRMGTHKSAADSYQRLWGSTTPPTVTTRTTASKIVLTADHTTMVTDPNDVVYVKAQISDSSNRVVTSSSTAVTFSISGPGNDHRGGQRQHDPGVVPRHGAQCLPGAGVRDRPGHRRRHDHRERVRVRAHRGISDRAGERRRILFRAPAAAIDVVCLGATPESRRSPSGADRRLPERDRLLRIDVPARQRADAGAGRRLRAGRG